MVLWLVATASLLVGAILGAAIAHSRERQRTAQMQTHAATEAAGLSVRLVERDSRQAELSSELAAEHSRAATLQDRLDVALTDNASLKSTLDERTALLDSGRAVLDTASNALESARADLSASRAELAGLQTSLAHERSSSEEKLSLLLLAETRLREAFEALSAEALRKNNQTFLDLAKLSLGEVQSAATGELKGKEEAIEALVAPIRDTLQKVNERLAETEKDRLTSYTALTEQVRAVAEGQMRLQAETGNLVNALRAPITRGRWGEIQLKRVVEMAGMLEHCDFNEQPTVSTDSGRLRPDLIVHLPGRKTVVVDSKVPLAAYLDALDAPDEVTRAAKLSDHARQVRDHITKLGSKAYWDQFEAAPEMVFMFLPGESFFSSALQYDPSLIEYGVEHKVIPASPVTLIALLRAVAYGWRQERIAESAEQISALGKELHERIRTWAGYMIKIGKGLEGANIAYNSAVGSLESRVLVSARRFKELGAASSEDVPEVEPIDTALRELRSETTDFLPAVGDALPSVDSDAADA